MGYEMKLNKVLPSRSKLGEVSMYYIWREDNMVLAFLGSGKQQTFVPYGTRAATLYGLQAAILKARQQPGKLRIFVVAVGELPPNKCHPSKEKENEKV